MLLFFVYKQQQMEGNSIQLTPHVVVLRV